MKNKKILFILPLVLFIIVGCAIGGGSTTDAQPEQSAAPSSDAPNAEPTLVGVTVINGNEIVPVAFPEERSGYAGDFDSSKIVGTNSLVGGDRFTFGKFERPFNAQAMDTYFAHLDIIDTYVFQDDTWVYASLTLQGTDANGALPSRYAVEFDTDLNGKGDFLVIASSPSHTDWVANGVQVYQDADSSVGDKTPTTSDGEIGGNGFEKLIFDAGSGDDPELAWVRIASDSANTVQFAVKRALLGGVDAKYLVNMWAGNDLLDPAKFDINDHFTHEQAGAANRGFEIFYPIKGIAEIDNSCRMAVGFMPNGSEPGLCDLPTVPGEAGVAGCTATPAIILACGFNDPSYAWNVALCSCEFVGPK